MYYICILLFCLNVNTFIDINAIKLLEIFIITNERKLDTFSKKIKQYNVADHSIKCDG